MLNNLMREESVRLSNEIQATVASLKVHYQHEDTKSYNFKQPYVTMTTSYLWDTSDFIQKLEEITDLGGNDQIFSMDVTSLYSNIPRTEGIGAIKHTLQPGKKNHLVSRDFSSCLSWWNMWIFSIKGQNLTQRQAFACLQHGFLRS